MLCVIRCMYAEDARVHFLQTRNDVGAYKRRENVPQNERNA